MDEAPAPLGSSASHQESEGDQCQLQADRSHASASNDSSSKASDQMANRSVQTRIDTTAPIDSVKGAANKFGGSLDLRERRKQAQDELDKVQEKAVKELGGANGVIDELTLGLEKAQAEEARARQDAEIAELRLRETQQGVSESTAAKAELAVARDRHANAVADLQSVTAELEILRMEQPVAAAKADAAAARARRMVSSSQEAVKVVEELTAELVALKKELDASHHAHDEAEEKRMRLAQVLEQDKDQWQLVLEVSEQEVKKLRNSLIAAADLEYKVEAASEQLAALRAELFAHAVEGTIGEEAAAATASFWAKLDKTKKELEDVKATVDKAKDEAKCLRVAAASLSADLEKQKAELAALRRRDGVSATSIPSLEEELSRLTAALTAAQEARAKERSVETKLGALLEEARREAAQAKGKCPVGAGGGQQGQAGGHPCPRPPSTPWRRAWKRRSGRHSPQRRRPEMAAASAAALQQEDENARRRRETGVGEGSVTLTMEEYDELSRRARETEEIAGKRVTEAVKLIKEAKDAEVRSLEKMAQLAKQVEQRRQALEAATMEVEEAEFSKLAAERELRQWRAEHEHQRRLTGEGMASPRTGLAEISVFDGGEGRGNPHILSPRGGYMPRTEMAAAEVEAGAKQRPTFFPRMVMFLARKRAQNWK
ncbi:hypothetical protein OsJ_09124 [Oryza sativa Japonica Group]|uniref:Uncharacterized protein n=1 Tax=Oryza sativa subsp. japonica TaxID=39947 RepID=B9FAD6_ORYSJ|nr:hypothetical protein OsJ_09124 [Oryza sativa Japonica Group]